MDTGEATKQGSGNPTPTLGGDDQRQGALLRQTPGLWCRAEGSPGRGAPGLGGCQMWEEEWEGQEASLTPGGASQAGGATTGLRRKKHSGMAIENDVRATSVMPVSLFPRSQEAARVSEFPVANITNFHKRGSLKQQKAAL